MSGFSGAVKLTDLNDFIAPSQSCVLNLDGSAKQPGGGAEAPQGEVLLARRKRERPHGAHGEAPRDEAPSKPVKVTLHDCLACSGCLTSAETVLLEQQSTDEFLATLKDPSVAVVVSLSPQSRASLAASYGVDPATAHRKIAGFLQSLGVRKVLDTTASRDIALLETGREFLSRLSRAGTLPAADAPHGDAGPLPMLASACPGWVCYAEKTHGDFVLPYMSTTRSPQAVMGALVKRAVGPREGLAAEQIYHCCVMPCYDKKLEASRDDFVAPDTGARAGTRGDAAGAVPETDCVLTTLELEQLMRERGVDDLASVPDGPLDPQLTARAAGGGLAGHAGGASGGYLDFAYREAARALGVSVPPGPLPLAATRNPDMREVSLEVPGGPTLRFAAAYGFRNIQGIIRRMKRGQCSYHFVEVMACPSGCNNGGGQVRPRGDETPADVLRRVEAAYDDPGIVLRGPRDAGSAAQLVYDDWLGGESPGGVRARELFHTAYHKREKTVTATIADW